MARMRLDAAPLGVEKILRKSAKQLAWIAIGLWTGFSFVGYFTPIHSLAASALVLDWSGWELFWVLFYGFATYGNAGWMREQVCKYMCPYARFQSVMFDKDTLIVTYDEARGEPRGGVRPQGRKTDLAAANLGDCIDCNLCVQVCPTGIDIRKGLQYECIACTACIDVCNGVMDKMQYPKGLIRFDTQNNLQQHLAPQEVVRRIFRPRVLVYTAILFLICGGLATSLWMRSPFKVDVERDRGALARLVDDGWVENVYRLQIMNTTEQVQHYRVAATGLAQMVTEAPVSLEVGPAQALWVPVALRVPPAVAESAGTGAHSIQFTVQRVVSSGDEPARVQIEKSTFVVPR
jgi:cytochrome c oxidase accessory protein FixG